MLGAFHRVWQSEEQGHDANRREEISPVQVEHAWELRDHSRTGTGLNVEDSGRRLDNRWMKGCRLSQPTLETARKRGPLKYEPLLAAMPNPEETDQRRPTRRYADGP